MLTSLDSSADYGVCCDWWSLGIIAYELLYETTPFEAESTSQTYNNIMNYKVSVDAVASFESKAILGMQLITVVLFPPPQKTLSFPGVSESQGEEEAKDLIKGLLTDMKTRLVCSGIQNHPFFSCTDWEHLLNCMINLK